MNIKPLQIGPTRYLKESMARPLGASSGVRRSVPVTVRHVELKSEEVLCLKKSSGINGIQIREGTIWVTETPATRDILLQAGDQLEFSGHWPVVIQALGKAQAALLA